MPVFGVRPTSVFCRSPFQITCRGAAAAPRLLHRQQTQEGSSRQATALSPRQVSLAASSMSRPTLVLVHGNFGTAAGWSPFQAAMELKGYQVYAVDLPWEKSPRTGGVPDLQDYVDALVSFVRSKQLNNIALVGHSFGGVPVSLATEGTNISCLVFASPVEAFSQTCNFLIAHDTGALEHIMTALQSLSSSVCWL